jgi:tight adherence protein B
MSATTQQFEKQIPMLLRLLENALRSGYNVAQSLELATEELSSPALEEVKQTITEFKSGAPAEDVLLNWLKRTPSQDLNLMIATIRVQLEVGGNLADKLNLLGQILDKRIKI